MQKLYFNLSNNQGLTNVAVSLNMAMEYIADDKESQKKSKDAPIVYTLTPIYMTKKDFESLPEFDY